MSDITEFASMTPEQLEGIAAKMRAGSAGQPMPGTDTTPTPAPPQDPYAPVVWGTTEYDFRVPSGQLCRLRKMKPEELMAAGILDKLTRLPAYAQELADKAEGKPQPKTDGIPKPEEIKAVVEVLDLLLPLVVVQPQVRSTPPEGAERVRDVIYTDDIDLADRVAIMERVTSGVVNMDNFRQEP